MAAVVFGFLVTGLAGAIIYGRASSANAGNHTRAAFLAEEGIEATRSIGDAAFANLVDCPSGYGLTQSGSPLVWAFQACSTTDTTGIYTRKVVIATASTNRKTITSTVTWPLPGGTTGNVTVTSQFANWLAATKSWSNAAVGGAVNATGTNDALKTMTVGDYNYTVLNATTTNNFIITNISNPALPTSSIFSIPGTPTNIFVSGGYAYITNQLDTAELQIVDVGNPAVPTVVKTIDMIGGGNGLSVYVLGTVAYVTRALDPTTNAFELTTVNVATPPSATVLGGINNSISMNDVYVSGASAYVATSSTTAEMLVMNVSTPAAPSLAATYNPATTLAALTVTGYGNTVLLGMSTTLDAINVTSPAVPVRLGVFTAAGTINKIDVDITKQYAFLATSSTTGEFQIVNITSPSAMTLTKTVDITGTTSTAGGVAYNSAYDTVTVASASDTQELLIYIRG